VYVVGSDLVAIELGRAVPSGRQHAVSAEGRMLCRPARPRFTWPGQLWGDAAGTQDAYQICGYVLNAAQGHRRAGSAPAELAYPVEPPAPRPEVEAVAAGNGRADHDPESIGMEPIWW
jgi:hypothetical protein